MRIARRGITYGERPYLYDPDPSVLPSAGVGLLFMSFQANLRQFAIQQGGSDSDTFPFQSAGAFSGLETVIGQATDAANVRPQVFPFQDANDPAAVREMRMINFVRMLGGEYFFAPSLTFLRSLVRL
jgi:deferrochelatase/peroxidase EfeB